MFILLPPIPSFITVRMIENGVVELIKYVSECQKVAIFQVGDRREVYEYDEYNHEWYHIDRR